jgi:hypothetical protein
MTQSERSGYHLLIKRLQRVRSYLELMEVAGSSDMTACIDLATPAQRLTLFVLFAKRARHLGGGEDAYTPAKVKVAWLADNGAMINKLIQLAAIHPRDEDLARAMGITVPQAKRARLRFVGGVYSSRSYTLQKRASATAQRR